ncbi:CHASE2 domain-containing protein [Paraburkholderia sediminicola]|nr:CHASE2 domain-containing protein [Paraburkholderia sediminicola]
MFTKNWFETTPPGRWAETSVFSGSEMFLSRFSSHRLPVVVLDIQQLEDGFTTAAPTSRKELTDIIKALNAVGAKAIGVDIDFSPDEQGFISHTEDPPFFDTCLEISKTTPVFLGVYRTRFMGPESWLNQAKYQSLAADLAGNEVPGRTVTMRAKPWLVVYPHKQSLPSMGYALARAASGAAGLPGAYVWLKPFVISDEEAEAEARPETAGDEERGRLLNYSKLDQLATERSLATDSSAITRAAADFAGKIVVLGDNNPRRNGGDVFHPPWHDEEPGVLFHSIGVYTFAFEPLFEFTHSTRTGLDLLLTLPFFLIAYLKARHAGRAPDAVTGAAYEESWKKIELRTILISTGVIILAGVLLLFVCNVLWLDFVLVIGALTVHPFLSRRMERLSHWLAPRSSGAQGAKG